MLRQLYIASGLITPAPPKPVPMTADELDTHGFHQAARAKRNRR